MGFSLEAKIVPLSSPPLRWATALPVNWPAQPFQLTILVVMGAHQVPQRIDQLHLDPVLSLPYCTGYVHFQGLKIIGSNSSPFSLTITAVDSNAGNERRYLFDGSIFSTLNLLLKINLPA